MAGPPAPLSSRCQHRSSVPPIQLRRVSAPTQSLFLCCYTFIMKEIKHVPSPLPALLAQEGPHVPRGPSVGLGRTVLPVPVPVTPPSQHLHPSSPQPGHTEERRKEHEFGSAPTARSAEPWHGVGGTQVSKTLPFLRGLFSEYKTTC